MTIRLLMESDNWLYLDHVQGNMWKEQESGITFLFESNKVGRKWEYVYEDDKTSVETDQGEGGDKEQEETGTVSEKDP